MAYSFQWCPAGVIKRFTGKVAFDDINKSEKEIAGSSRFTELKFVISDYLNAESVSLTDMQRQEIRALRIGGFYSNPRIRYAFATQDPTIRHSIEQSVRDRDFLHPVKVFSNFEDAHKWATGDMRN